MIHSSIWPLHKCSTNFLFPDVKLFWNLMALFIHSISVHKTLLRKKKSKVFFLFCFKRKKCSSNNVSCKLTSKVKVYKFIRTLFSALLTTETTRLYFAETATNHRSRSLTFLRLFPRPRQVVYLFCHLISGFPGLFVYERKASGTSLEVLYCKK